MKNMIRYRAVAGLLLAAVLAMPAFAGEPIKPLPEIGLTRFTAPRVPNQDLQRYPFGMILVPQAPAGGVRYVLVPVTIVNCFDSIPIYSFQFSVDYDPTVLKAVDVQKIGPPPLDNVGLANSFHITFHDTTAPPQTDSVLLSLHERITISGSSTIPLPLTTPASANGDCRAVDTLDLLYIRFQVVGQYGAFATGSSLMNIPNDTNLLFWNDYTPIKLYPTAYLANHLFGLIGPDSLNYNGSPTATGNKLTVGYGKANLVITQQPALDLSFFDNDVEKLDDYNYSLTTRMYADSGSTSGSLFERFHHLDVLDSVQLTQMTNLVIQSNEPWLKVAQTQFSPTQSTYVIDLLDNTLNPLLRSDSIQIVVDLTYFENNGLPAGVYNGVLTFTQDGASNTPTKLNVRFVYFRNPIENTGDPTNTYPNTSGIHVLVQNSAAAPQSALLTFGTGVGATDGADELFGETEYPNPPAPGSFFARWYPESLGPAFNGLNDESDEHTFNFNSQGYGSVSRDIRGWRVDTTILYHCIYGLGGVQNYPVVLTWDTTDFPPGSRLILRDTLNGSRFAVDMRHSTPNGGAVQSYTIRDRDLNSFVIEYTPGSVETTPGIVKGWNLVSLPVLSPDPRVSTVFPNALDNHTAFLFFQSDYQQVNTLDFGRGYFVKWGNIITSQDTEVAGIRKFSLPATDNVQISDGWNSIGSLSVPIQTSGISFAPSANSTPKLVYNMVWQYDNNLGYSPTTAIYPGRGYWIQIKGDGFLVLSQTAPPIAEENSGTPIGKDAAAMNVLLNQLTVRDNAHRAADVYFGSTSKNFDLGAYALPPAPPSPAFDVRFATNRSVEPSVTDGGSILRFQTTDYPVVLSCDNVKGDYEIADLSGNVLGEFGSGNSGAITINNRNVHAVQIIAKSSAPSIVPANESLTQNYPNPFNLSTDFFYSVPATENVTIKVLNALGQDVTTLVNGAVDAGTYKVHFDATNLPEGIYYYKMTAGDFTATHKMILMK